MKLATTIVVVALIVVLGIAFVSWMNTTVSASGQFEMLPDGNIRYTHTLTNETWHPVRYIIAADPESQVKTILVQASSSDPDKTVTRTDKGTGKSPWSVELLVPGHQEASIDVTFKLEGTLEGSPSYPGLTATPNTRGIYPSYEVLLNVSK